MPTYDYLCLDCKKRFDVYLTYEQYGSTEVLCASCGSGHVRRRLSRIRVLRSDESRLESYADPGALNGLDDNPEALGRMMRKMSREVGEEMPPEFDEVVDRLEKGQSPEDIERDMPDMTDDVGGNSMEDVF